MLLRIDAKVYLDAPDDADPEAIAQEFDQGFYGVVQPFESAFDDGREVLRAEVREISLVGEDEAIEKGLVE